MQGKGLIKFVAIALAIACLYSLSFTWVSRKVEKDAKEYAKGDLAKERAYLDSIATVPVYNLGFTKFTYQYCKEREIPLGLDLKGGMNLTMEISLEDLVRNLANNPSDANFNKALQNAEARTKTSQKDFISLFGEEYEKLNPNGKLVQFFATKDNANNLKINASNSDVLSFLQKEANSAIDRSFNILRTRIDKFGVASPNIQRQQGTNRILIELPGVSDPNRVRKLLQGSAKLEFWETFDNTQIFPLLENINKILAANQSSTDTTKKAVATSSADTAAQKAGGKLAALGAKKDTTGKDSAGLAKNMAEQVKNNPLFSLLTPAFYQTQNGQQALRPGPVVGYAAQKDTAKINNYFHSEAVKAIIPGNVKLLWSVKPMSPETKVFELYAIKITRGDGAPILDGSVITDAKDDIDQHGNPDVTMYMNSEGAREWRRITAAASADANNKQSIAIVLDDVVYSAPTVQNEIPNGISQITGNFQLSDTKDLANVLKAGRLPAPARIAGEYIVGPSLGQEAIHNGLLSFIVAFGVILIFMAFYYNRAGWVANVALLINLFFIMGILASLGAVLTLPGIAGIVLTIGLSVDANILIFERVREELAHGKQISIAIREGFRHAMSSIIDSNVTILILGIILYIFGSGPVQGFATTLCIGIVSSLFAAVLISRVIFEYLLDHKHHVSFDNKITHDAFRNIAFNFVGHRKLYYSISSAIIVLGIIFYLKHGGLNLGIDFKGGRTYIVHFDKNVNAEDIKAKLTPHFDNEVPEVKTAGGDNQLKITTTYHVADQNQQADKVVTTALEKGLAESRVKYDILSSQKVGPLIANDIVYGAYAAVLFSCLVMFIYIVVRFRKWQYGLGAVVALFHDVFLVLSFYTILDGLVPFSLEIGQDFIAAILTVMGYTMTETVVVFDRIREKLTERGKSDLHGEERNQLINFALNSTLSRTILTSLTVFFVLLVIFIFGGDSIRGFIFALLIGRIIGTYSSLCISTPIVIDFGSKETK
ncbi:protein translocase subunit SecDF [Pedobacter sp. BS3]|uniref:protein translocase subunit SecDF n=1 Tax=Pedobacter sp. BS3 TaxID=2567937 RepID=UPI0011EC6290|nr:protein translocase subunit SecDF [Pedobacter sp. BS3]TZF82561.1 protein translocase subunit SecDF [Pedobacter sp. BS3]